MSLQSLWSQMSGIVLPTYATAWQLPIIDGQSLALGYNGSPTERASVAYVSRASTKMLTGMQRSDAAAVFIHGPSSLGYNATAATGIVAASAAANIPMVFLFALGLDKWRRELARPLNRMIVGFNGQAGQSIVEFDDDSPSITGSLGTVLRDNHTRWVAEARTLAPGASPLVYGMVQGEADVSMSAAAYLAAATEAYDDALDDLEAATGTRPPLMLWQTGGYVDSTGDLYGSTLAQLQLVEDFGGIFAGPIYPYLTHDNTVHPGHEESIIMSEIGAYVFARHEMGQNLSMLPGTPVLDGNEITIPFSGLEAGKSLVFDPVDKYAAYGGLANHGCEVSGTTVTDVTLSGNAVTITAAAAIAGRTVSIAMQAQDMTANAVGGANYPGHRCDIMESDPEESAIIPGRLLKRFIPSCQFAIAAAGVAPSFVALPSITPTTGTVGQVYTLDLGTYAGDAPITPTWSLTHSVDGDVTGAVVAGEYDSTGATAGTLTLSVSLSNAAGTAGPETDTATVSAAPTGPTPLVEITSAAYTGPALSAGALPAASGGFRTFTAGASSPVASIPVSAGPQVYMIAAMRTGSFANLVYCLALQNGSYGTWPGVVMAAYGAIGDWVGGMVDGAFTDANALAGASLSGGWQIVEVWADDGTVSVSVDNSTPASVTTGTDAAWAATQLHLFRDEGSGGHAIDMAAMRIFDSIPADRAAQRAWAGGLIP